MATETRFCEYCNAGFEPARSHQRFCSNICRLHDFRYGGPSGNTPADKTAAESGPADTTISSAIRAAEAFTPIVIGDHKTTAAIKVGRAGPDPNAWTVTVPPNSAIAATKIHQELTMRIQDLTAFANKLGAQIGEPRIVLQTRTARTKT
jgi:hypothetical protein